MKKKFVNGAASIIMASQIITTSLPLVAQAEEQAATTEEDLMREASPELEVTEQGAGNAEQNIEDSKPESSEDSVELDIDNSGAELDALPETQQEENDKSEETPTRAATMLSAVIVRDATELRTALTNATVTHITLASDITLTSSVVWYGDGASKTIEGNNHTLMMGTNVQIIGGSHNQSVSINNLRIVANVGNAIQQNGLNARVSFNNLTFENSNNSGRLLTFLAVNASVRFSGNNTITGSALSWGYTYVMSVDDGASVSVDNRGTLWSVYATTASIELGEGSTLDITQNTNINIPTVWLSHAGSEINVKNNATLKVNGGPNSNKGYQTISLNGALNVESGGTLDVVGQSLYSTLLVAATSTFHAGSNIRIQNNHRNGTAIGAYPVPAQYRIFSTNGMQTWNRSANFTDSPTFNYTNFTNGSFSLNSYTTAQSTTSVQSNDNTFFATFNSADIGKIVTGSFIDEGNIQQTTIHTLAVDSTVITGNAEANGQISIEIDGQFYTSGSVASDGTYSFGVQNPQWTAGSTVRAIVTANGQTSAAETTVQASDWRISETTVQDVYTDTTTIRGTAEPNAELSITIEGDPSIEVNGRVGSDGRYSVEVPLSPLVAGSKITVSASLNGHTAEAITTVIGINQGTITPDAYQVGTSNISGTYTGDVARANLLVNGRSISWGGTFSNGTFSYFVNSNVIGRGDTVELVAYDANDKELDRQTVVVEYETEGTLTPNPYQVGMSNITGSYTGDVVRANLLVNGRSISWGGTFSNGTFSYFVNSNVIGREDTVELVAYDANDKELDRQTVTVNYETQGTISPAAYQVGSSNITGSYTGDVVRANLLVNGRSISWGGTFSNGTFSYFVNSNVIGREDTVELVAYDANDQELDRQTVTVNYETEGTITPNPYTTGDRYITGQVTGDVAIMNLLVNGRSISWGGTFSNGTFSYYVNPEIIQSGNTVTLVAYDANNKELDRQTVQVESSLTGTISPDVYKLGSANITGTFSGDINFGRLLINGETAAWGGTYREDGTFSFYVGNLSIQETDEVKLEVYNRVSSALMTSLGVETIEIAVD